MQEKFADIVQQRMNGTSKIIANISYDIKNKIGSGFSSTVFKGINIHNSDNLAIKVIQLNTLTNQVQKTLIHNQIESLKKLDYHQNIANFKMAYQTKEYLYIGTQYCDGSDLYTIIKKNKNISQNESKRLFFWILQGYIHIASKGILHRDLKTSNIMLHKGQPKIIDFGFSDHQSYHKPNVYYNVGSPAYMSPESYYDNQYSIKSDIWSLGVILYQMLVGDTICTKNTYAKMVSQIESGNIPFPDNIIISSQTKELLKTIFNTNKNQRINLQLLDKMCKNFETPKLERIYTPTQNKSIIKPIRVLTAVQPKPSTQQIVPQQQHQFNNHSLISNQLKNLIIYGKNNIDKQNKHYFTPAKQNRVNISLNIGINSDLNKKIQDNNRFGYDEQYKGVLMGQIEYVKFLFRLLKMINQSIFTNKNDIKFILIKMLNSLMKGLKESFIYGKNFFMLNEWNSFFHRLPELMKEQYNFLYNKISEYAKNNLKDTSLVPNIIGLFEGNIQKWKQESSLNKIENILINKFLQFQKVVQHQLINVNLTDKLQKDLSAKIIILDYVLVVIEILRLHKKMVGYREFRKVSKIKEIINSRPEIIYKAHFSLIKQKKKYIIQT